MLNTRRKAAAACVEAVPFCARRAHTPGDTSVFFIRLCHQRGEKAWRRPFPSPRCTIHGSREERNGAFMNFTSPARRKLHKNSIKTPEDDLLDILVAIKLTLDNDTFENTGKSRFFERRTSRVLY